MAKHRLPKMGEDDWGGVLNGYLSVSHNEDGSLKPVALSAAGAVNNLADLSDVSTDVAPVDNQVLSYDATSSSWQPATLQALATGDGSLVTSVAGRTGDVTLAESDIANLVTDIAATEKIARKGQPGGYASLDTGGKIPMSQLQPFPMPKQSVSVCMTTPVNISSPGATLDGQNLPVGARVLLVGQSPGYPGYQNGLYSYNGPTTAMTRTLDANTGALIQNAFVYVNLGSQAQAGWENVTAGPIGINATPLTWKQFEAPLLSQPTGQLNDSNGNPVLIATGSVNAVNQVTLANAITGMAPSISSSGTDANVGLQLDTQGAGAITATSAVSITNPNGGPDLLVQNSSGSSDSYIRVQGWGTKAAYVFINSQNVAYGYLAGQVSGSTKWAIGRNGSNNGTTIYTFDGSKPAAQFDDNQTTRLYGGLAYKRTAVTSSTYTIAVNDCLVAYTGPAQAVAFTLPAANTVTSTGGQAQMIIVKDEVGVASNNPIAINAPGSGMIDGITRQIPTNFGSLRFYSDGTNWHVLS